MRNREILHLIYLFCSQVDAHNYIGEKFPSNYYNAHFLLSAAKCQRFSEKMKIYELIDVCLRERERK